MLDREPYLLVLDGLERILIAYARMDAARLADDDLDQQTANMSLERSACPQVPPNPSLANINCAKPPTHASATSCASWPIRAPRASSSARASTPPTCKPATGGEAPGSRAYFLQGLADDDALNLWRASGVSGTREALLPLFRRFDKPSPAHPGARR